MRVLVACEFSGVVAKAFSLKGHDVSSCDLLDCKHPDRTWWHYHGPVEDILDDGWDLIIAHPPCTYLAVSGNRWYSHRPDLYIPAADFAKMFIDHAEKVCIENPVGRLSKLWRPPDQYIQPWEHGEPHEKKTGLWLKNLPHLVPTKIVEKPPRVILKSGKSLPAWYNLPPSKERSNIRSETFQGIANAMAEQWG